MDRNEFTASYQNLESTAAGLRELGTHYFLSDLSQLAQEVLDEAIKGGCITQDEYMKMSMDAYHWDTRIR